MTDYDKIRMPENALPYFSIISLLFIFFQVLTNEISRQEIQTILNTYIIIQIAIISVAFVAMSMKSDEMRKDIYNNLFALSLVSMIFMAVDILLYFSSYLNSTDSFLLKFTFGGATWMTFLSLFMMLSVFMQFNPDLLKQINKE
jgi:hypothetical protein